MPQTFPNFRQILAYKIRNSYTVLLIVCLPSLSPRQGVYVGSWVIQGSVPQPPKVISRNESRTNVDPLFFRSLFVHPPPTRACAASAIKSCPSTPNTAYTHFKSAKKQFTFETTHVRSFTTNQLELKVYHACIHGTVDCANCGSSFKSQ